MNRTIRATIHCLLPAACFGVYVFLVTGCVLIALAPLKGRAESGDARTEYLEVKNKIDALYHSKGYGVARLNEDRKSGDLHPTKNFGELKKQLLFWDRAYRLQTDLYNRYLEIHSDTGDEDKKSLYEETNRLAIGLIRGIEKLRKDYKIGTFPLVHNLLIQVHVKKRGACKHWAEDLLTLINTMEHPHFTSLWAEAHPGTMREHNVAVLVPKGAPYDEGILIDPWRTAGVPFWIEVKKDSYPWHSWSGYEAR